MEVMAVIEALRGRRDPLEIVSDSSYVVKCFNDKWHVGWLRRGWKNSQGQRSPIVTWEEALRGWFSMRNVTCASRG